MTKKVVVFGASGNLGGKIVDFLLARGAEVVAIVRLESDQVKLDRLKEKGVNVFEVNFADKSQITKLCVGAHCVVSALAGLRETIIDVQKIIVEAAISAKVRRFIPSDYSIDFRNLEPGQNRNLDMRRDFHQYLENVPIQSTTIFNGAFMDLLTTDMPLIMFKQKRILCWGNPDQVLDFTTTSNVADFTAAAAMEDETQRYLTVAGDRLSCNDFVMLLQSITGRTFKLFRPGGIKLFNLLIKITKFFAPSKNELYPAWQGMQYMRDMMEGRVKVVKYENLRYPDINWTSVKKFLISEKDDVLLKT